MWIHSTVHVLYIKNCSAVILTEIQTAGKLEAIIIHPANVYHTAYLHRTRGFGCCLYYSLWVFMWQPMIMQCLTRTRWNPEKSMYEEQWALMNAYFPEAGGHPGRGLLQRHGEPYTTSHCWKRRWFCVGILSSHTYSLSCVVWRGQLSTPTLLQHISLGS